MPQDTPQQGTDTSAQLMQQILAAVSGMGKSGGTGGVPGASLPPPSPNIRFDPSGAPGGGFSTAGPRPTMPTPPTGSQSLGKFTSKGEATNAGLVSLGNSLSGLFGAVEAKEHAKKAAMAENYLLQINSLIQSGDPNDRKKAEMFLEDPKIRKILKTGLDFVPLEEEVPPEAQGVQTAIQKIQKKGEQQQPPMRPVMPQPSTQQKLQQAMQNAILQQIQKDPAKAISMMGGSQLSSAEEHAGQLYEKGLGLSPAQVATMTAQEKLAGLRVLEMSMRDYLKTEVDMKKAELAASSREKVAGMGASARIDSAKIMADAKKYAADKYVEAAKNRKGAAINNAAGAKMYEDFAKKYLDLAKSPNVSSDDKTRYEKLAQQYQSQADDYLNKVGEDDLVNEFMQSIEDNEEPEN